MTAFLIAIAALGICGVLATFELIWTERRAKRARAIDAAMRRHPAGSAR
jgi:hypothetical protein